MKVDLEAEVEIEFELEPDERMGKGGMAELEVSSSVVDARSSSPFHPVLSPPFLRHHSSRLILRRRWRPRWAES